MKMLSEMVKFTSQHRALYCYLIMSVWIFLIIAGMYKYIATEEGVSMPKQSAAYRRENRHHMKGDTKFKKITNKYCNAADHINLGSEGLADESWALQGVMVIIRHGDRGPLTHVKGIESVDCNVPYPSQLLHRYQEYITNMTALGKAPWSQSPGPFHNLPLLPGMPAGACRLGQLTPRGLLQLLTTGHLLGQAYTNRLGWDFYGNKTEYRDISSSNAAPKSTGNTKSSKNQDVTKKAPNNPLNQPVKTITNDDSKTFVPSGRPADGDIVVHSTRYRRALQSALALLWGALGEAGGPGGGVGGASARESPSLTFCSEDCACPAAEFYARKVSQESKKRLEIHPAIGELVTYLSNIVFQAPSQSSKDPHILEDALLAYLCHTAVLPCLEKPVEDSVKNPKNLNSIKDSPLNYKTADGRVRGLLDVNESDLDSTKHLGNSPSRSLLQTFSLNNFESSFQDRVLIRKIRDIRIQGDHRKSPVLDFDSQMEKEKIGYYQQKLMENADINYEDVIVIKRNMDGDFNFNGDNLNNPETEDDDSEDYDDKDDSEKDPLKKPNSDVETLCVKKEQVMSLFAYTDWEMKQYAKSTNLKKASLLRAFGMIRHIVKYILKIISEGKPKFVLFSGHDKTIQFLSLALGLADDNFLNIHYASRMVIEIYKNEDKEYMKNKKSWNGRMDGRKSKVVAPLDFFLRVVMNGQDVTRQLSFCRGNRSILADNLMKVNGHSGGRKNKSYLCRIENIIRFTHEDYFSIFNASNFKDACTIRKL